VEIRYLDGGSSEPLLPRAREVLLAALDAGYADPLRLHKPARDARLLLDNARAAVAECLDVRPEEVTFTSSGTAAVHLGLLGLLRARRQGGAAGGGRPLLSAVEHSAVFGAARWWADLGGPAAEVLPVDPVGRVDPAGLAAALKHGAPAAAVAVQQANPEIGTLQDLEAVAAASARHNAPLFVDACAGGARLPLPATFAAAALSAHKWGGPAGVGVLVVRTGTRWRAPLPTDDRADPRTSGFENIPAVLAAAAALQDRVAERDRLAARHEEYAAELRAALAGVPDVEVHGDPDPAGRLPHLVSFSCLYVDGETLVQELDRRGFAVASGSACTASALAPSHVLVAVGALTHGNARVTFGPATTLEDVRALAAALPAVVTELRGRVSR
jgi:cysteine desulfurase